ncbi:hypothetical protein K505DRAFT_375869 [Melanomma pulvis-pyrius CBS 109.77]|uniref:Uncharacterized protein n=1 Tax=Melanomma pulvis-pyrius CBS 109.77 TaxID=1314802 RepID=A0A6A6X8K3_9PLEO|nr:hypothetical protein K505DRAFT_375869 [Melanomma pulvis-pyrius CBS 109.77]
MSWPSDLTPASFVDDGLDIASRMPTAGSSDKAKRGSSDNAKRGSDVNTNAWADGVSGNEVPSSYTGSFFDDGADMLPRRAPGPGFGEINKSFFEASQRHKKVTKNNLDIQRAVSGDINATMKKIRAVGEIRVREDPQVEKMKASEKEKARKEEEAKKAEEERKKQPVTFEIPYHFGTFVIHGEDGRVIVVDSDGEYDSGPMPQPRSQPMQQQQQQQQQPQVPPPAMKTTTKKRVRKHVNFEGLETTLSTEKVKTAIAFPPATPAKRVPKAKARPEKKKVAEKKEQDHWMSGGRSGWPSQSKPTNTQPPKNNPEVQEDTWASGGVGGWPSPYQPYKKPEDKQEAWSNVAVRSPSPAGSEDSWMVDLKEMEKTLDNYKTPTVEDVPETPSEERKH